MTRTMHAPFPTADPSGEPDRYVAEVLAWSGDRIAELEGGGGEPNPLARMAYRAARIAADLHAENMHLHARLALALSASEDYRANATTDPRPARRGER